MKNNNLVISVVVCLLIALISFWGGVKYQSSKSPTGFGNRQDYFSQNGNTSKNNQQGMRFGANGGGLVNGEVISMDDKSATVKLRDGGSKIVFFTPQTKIEKTVDGTTSDLVVGKQIMTTGTTNPDGSINASSIQIRPVITNQ